MSADYKFNLLEGDRIVAVMSCACAHDSDALLEADAFLQASECPVVEVWNGQCRIAILSKPVPDKDEMRRASSAVDEAHFKRRS